MTSQPQPPRLPSIGPRELKLELPAVHSAARMARHLVRQFAKSFGVSGRDLDSLLLVTEELLTNAVDHGGGGSARDEAELEEPVRMSLLLHIHPGRWEMRVSDQGGGDPEVVEKFLHPDALPDLDEERGRGFFLLTQMVEELRVEKSADGRGLMMIAAQHYGERG